MLIIMNSASGREDVERVREVADGLGYESSVVDPTQPRLIRIFGYSQKPHPDLFENLPGVDRVLPIVRPVRKVGRDSSVGDTVVRVLDCEIGGGQSILVVGPCAVEDEEQILSVARLAQRAGADMIRGGAYKPRSSPYDFQGLGESGLRMLARARNETGLPVVTEAVDEASLELVEQYADIIQIGARNMQNFQLLKRVGKSRCPVLLKRGMSASLEDLLLSAEYILEGGNPNVILCERGIRTFSDHSRYTLDLSIVPILKHLTHLPILVDPSHSSGRRSSVAPLAMAALAAGADGVMVEVHPDPEHALCDGPQSLPPEEFIALAAALRAMAPVIARQRETVS